MSWDQGEREDANMCLCSFACQQRRVRPDRGSGSRRRRWCWPAATCPRPSCRRRGSAWACWQTLPAPWRSWATSAPSMTASRWSSGWAAAPLSRPPRTSHGHRHTRSDIVSPSRTFLSICKWASGTNPPSPTQPHSHQTGGVMLWNSIVHDTDHLNLSSESKYTVQWSFVYVASRPPPKSTWNRASRSQGARLTRVSWFRTTTVGAQSVLGRVSVSGSPVPLHNTAWVLRCSWRGARAAIPPLCVAAEEAVWLTELNTDRFHSTAFHCFFFFTIISSKLL